MRRKSVIRRQKNGGEFKRMTKERGWEKGHNYQGHREAFSDVELNGSLPECSCAKWLTLPASVMLTSWSNTN